jgi:hypothetical protein
VPRFNLIGFAVALVLVAGCVKAASESSPAASADVAAAPAAAPGGGAKFTPVDLCSLVTKEEAESVLGKRLAAPQKQGGGDCWYMREGGSDFGDVEFILSIIYPPVKIESARDFDAFVAQQAAEMNDNVKKQGINAAPFAVEPARDVGAPAYFIDPGLYVLKGNRILAVGLGGSKGVAIAKIALARMP